MRTQDLGRRRVRISAAATVVGLALVVAGCGGDDASMEDDTTAAVESGGEGESEEPAEEMAGDEAGEDAMEDSEAGEESGGQSEETGAREAAEEEPELAAGVYRAYSEDLLAEAGYDTNIIFFHASWCPECRAFEQALTSEPIPAGVQVLKVDYDTETELKQRYGITIQTTFVRVDADGEEISTWVGYGQDRSIEALLNELG